MKKKNVEGGWKLQFIFPFIETTHKLSYLDKLSLKFGAVKDNGHILRFIW
jgi:hypothetical protein